MEVNVSVSVRSGRTAVALIAWLSLASCGSGSSGHNGGASSSGHNGGASTSARTPTGSARATTVVAGPTTPAVVPLGSSVDLTGVEAFNASASTVAVRATISDVTDAVTPAPADPSPNPD
jgi:hypothetical protein